MARKKGMNPTPDADALQGFVKSGKTMDWICEKWNVTPQTVRAWFAKFNITLPKKPGTKTSYVRKIQEVEKKPCPVCQEKNQVNYIFAEKHWFCMNCYTEFDQDNVIYIFDDSGELIEVIAHKPGLWDKLKAGKKGKNLIRTVTA
jgi:hypothetical protein